MDELTLLPGPQRCTSSWLVVQEWKKSTVRLLGAWCQEGDLWHNHMSDGEALLKTIIRSKETGGT